MAHSLFVTIFTHFNKLVECIGDTRLPASTTQVEVFGAGLFHVTKHLKLYRPRMQITKEGQIYNATPHIDQN